MSASSSSVAYSPQSRRFPQLQRSPQLRMANSVQVEMSWTPTTAEHGCLQVLQGDEVVPWGRPTDMGWLWVRKVSEDIEGWVPVRVIPSVVLVKMSWSPRTPCHINNRAVSVQQGDEVQPLHEPTESGWQWVKKVSEHITGWIPVWCLTGCRDDFPPDMVLRSRRVAAQKRNNSRSRSPRSVSDSDSSQNVSDADSSPEPQPNGQAHASTDRSLSPTQSRLSRDLPQSRKLDSSFLIHADVGLDNLCFVSYVLSEHCDMDKFLSHVKNTPAHIATIVCEEVDRICDEVLANHVLDQTALGDKEIRRLFPGGYLATHHKVCRSIQVHTELRTTFGLQGGPDFGAATVVLQPPQCTVTIGALRLPCTHQSTPEAVVSGMRHCIRKLRLRFLAGIFPNGNFQNGLWQMLWQEGAACAPFCQPFRGALGRLYAHPHFITVMGPIKASTAVADSEQPTLDEYIEHSWRDPDELCEHMNILEHWSMQPKAKMMGCSNLGKVIQKSHSWSLQPLGATQVMLWVGGRAGARALSTANCHHMQFPAASERY